MNITTLNTTTLDGNVIIKKGGGGTPTPPSGGDVLEGEHYLAKPNGWYWKVTDTFINSGIDSQNQTMSGLFLMMGSLYEVGYESTITNTIQRLELKLCYRDLGALQFVANKKLDYDSPVAEWRVIAEGGKTKIDMGEIVGEFESIYEALCALAMPMTETEFEAMMLAQYGLQRITKEEYEALITE